MPALDECEMRGCEPDSGSVRSLRMSGVPASNLGIYGTCRTLACLLASERPRGSNGSLTTVASTSAGMTTGVRRMMSSASLMVLTFGSQSVASWSSTARFPSSSIASEIVVEAASDSVSEPL